MPRHQKSGPAEVSPSQAKNQARAPRLLGARPSCTRRRAGGAVMRPAKPRPNARLISVAQACDEYGFTKDQLYKLIAARKLPAVELPSIKRVLLDRRDLDAAIESWKTVAA